MYRVGDKFVLKDADHIENKNSMWVLSYIPLNRKNYAALISLDRGYCWVFPKKVQDAETITEKEFELVCGGESYRFIKIGCKRENVHV